MGDAYRWETPRLDKYSIMSRASLNRKLEPNCNLYVERGMLFMMDHRGPGRPSSRTAQENRLRRPGTEIEAMAGDKIGEQREAGAFKKLR